MGRTGTGKTVAIMWHLSNANLKSKPWIVYNFKNDEHIESLPNTVDVDFDFIPKRKDTGIFVLHPSPGDAKSSIRGEQSELEKHLWKLWGRGNCGLVCDEGFIIGDNEAFDCCFVQGRSKHIQMLVGTQRPVWLTRFAYSESDFFQIFHLNDIRDKKIIEGFVPIDYSHEEVLPDFWSWYYDVGKNKLWKFKPVPDMDEIRAKIESKLGKKRRWFV